MHIEKVEDLIPLVSRRGKPVRLACAAPEDSESLEALRMAADAGIVQPLLVGRQKAIGTVASTLGISLEGFEFDDLPEQEEVARRAAQLVYEGHASILMKGNLTTKSLIRAVLERDRLSRNERMLSHVALFDAPLLGKPIILTDAGVNIKPNLAQKIEIVKNAAEVSRRLGVKIPKVAMLAAVERVELPAMRATLDARMVEQMGDASLLGEVAVQGPLALDDAVSPDVARLKALTGPVVGDADILVAPEIETANVLYKALTCFARLEGASIIWGAHVPVVVPSRADSARTKLLSIAFAAAMIEE